MKSLLPPLTAGLVCVLVGFCSTVAIVYQGATSSGASPQEASSWLSALCLGSGITSIYFSLKYRVPVLGAWSTPGAALLVGVSGFTLHEIIGAFILNGILITLAGITGVFEKALAKIPVSLASAMLVGILLKFGLEVFLSMKAQPTLVMAIFLAYLVSKRFFPRYAILSILFLGMVFSAFLGLLHFDTFSFHPPLLIFKMPIFSINALISVSLPLFVVTMASQNLPGVATMKSAGYVPPVSPIMTGTGILTALLAPFGGFAINLAAITAAICMGPEAHEDREKRYLAPVFAGIVYIILAVLAATVGTLLASFPKELIFTVAGIALFSTIGNGLHVALATEKERESALITFLVTASGVSFWGIGSAFWGLIAGVAAALILGSKKK